MQVGEIAFRPPVPLPIENIKLNVRTKVESCLSSPEPQPGFAIG